MSATLRTILLTGVACSPMLWPIPAVADTTPTQATLLEAQVRDALGGLLGPSVKLNDRPIQITADGDHYDVTVPLPFPQHASGSQPQAIAITGTARPGDNGTWIVENVKTTNPLTFTVDVALPPPGGQPDAPKKTVPVTYTLDQQGQAGRILWDPSFKTPSTWTISTQSTKLQTVGGPIQQESGIGPVSTVTTLRPAGPDRLDVLLDGTLQDYHIDTQPPVGPDPGQAPGPGPVQLAMHTVRVTSALNGVSREHAATLVRTMASLFASLTKTPSTPGQPPKIAPDLAKALLASLQDFASDFSLDETLEGFIMKAQGQTAALDRIHIGVDARSDAGLLRAGMNVGLEGLTLPDMPLGPMEALIPTRVALRPVIGGVAVADLVRLANQASENKNPAPDDVAALFSHGGVTGGLESMAIDVGGARFTGVAKIVATAPASDAVSGTATITAENFDALMQKVTSIPELAQQGVPVLVFIKGIGRNVDNKLVWDIDYKDGRVLINNVDLTAMAGGAGPAPARPAPATPRSRSPSAGPSGTARPLPGWAK